MGILEDFDQVTAENEPETCVCAFKVMGNKCAYHGRREMQREVIAQHEAGDISNDVFRRQANYLLSTTFPSKSELDKLR